MPAPSEDIEPDLGRLTLDLLTDRTWISRRVETVRYLDSSRLERRITLDIDQDALIERACKAGYGDGDEAPIPLLVLEKNLLLDLDVRDQDDTILSVVTSDVDATAAQRALLASLEDSGVAVASLPKAIPATILRATKAIPDAEDRATLLGESDENHTVDCWRLVDDLSGNGQQDADAWKMLLDDNFDFWGLLRDLTVSFMLMTKIKIKPAPTIVKIRYVETYDPAEPNFLERIGWDALLTVVVTGGVAQAAREHVRVEAPPGVVFDGAELWEVDRSLGEGTATRATAMETSKSYRRRVSLNRVAIYTSGLASGTFWIALSMRPDTSGFLRRAQYVILLGFLMLSAGAAAEHWWGTLTKTQTNNADPTVALLLLVPTLLVAYVAHEGEHEILGSLLRWPRVLVGTTALATLVAAAGLVVGVKEDALFWLWTGAAGCSALILAWLRAINFRTNQGMGVVRDDQGATEELPLTTIKSE